MDFLNEIIQESVVKDYLKDFPENDWKEVIKKTLLYGIHSLKGLENLGLASPRMGKIPALQSELAEMKKNIAYIESTLSNNFRGKKNLENSKENSRTAFKSRGTSQRNIREKSKNLSTGLMRGNSKDRIKQPPFRLTGKEKPEVRRKLPKYLLNVDSKIRNDVQKAKKGVLTSQNRGNKKSDEQSLKWEEWKTAEFSTNHGKVREESPKSSSSFSTYNAGDDIKDFYQKEFTNLMPSHGNSEKKTKKNNENTRKPLKVFSNSSSDSEA